MDQNSRLQTVEKTINILEAVRQNQPIGLTPLAEEVGYSTSSTFKHLNTLREKRMIAKDGTDYRLSFQLLKYVTDLTEENRLYTLLKPMIEKLGETTGELVVCGIKEQQKGVFLMAANNQYGYSKSLMGESYYLHQNSTGKAMLAECSDEEIERVIERQGLPRATENTITDRDELFDEIAKTRRRGYAYNDQERNEFRSIAAAFSSANTNWIGGVSVGGPPKRLSREDFENEYVNDLLALINEIEIKMNYELEQA